MRGLVQTPTFASTLIGCGSLVLWLAFDIPHTDLLSFVSFTIAGCGTAIALWAEVQRDYQTWGWKGLWTALRNPSKWFLGGFFGHLPQLLGAVVIALWWRSRRQ